MKYLVIEDSVPGSLGLKKALLYSGPKGVYLIREQGKTNKELFLHLEHKLGKPNASEGDIISEYMAYKKIDLKNYQYFRLVSLSTRVGVMHGRAVRPVQGFGSYYAYDRFQDELRATTDLYVQLDVFMHRLNEISRVIHPSVPNFRAYGYEIRSLLILACTEVELLFKRLIWNDVSCARGSMPAYYRSNKYARLSDYQVKLSFYNDLPALSPFRSWYKTNEYVPLDWYQSYNATKHNRHTKLESANLESLLKSLAACAVLLGASVPAYYSTAVEHPAVTNFKSNFKFVVSPSWSIEDHYWVIHGRSLIPADIL